MANDNKATQMLPPAQTDVPQGVPNVRASVRRHRHIGARPEAVWEVVGRAELLHLWFPGVVDCTMVDQVRTVTLGSGLKLDERIITCDPIQRRFQYRIEGGLFREHLATLDVLEASQGSSVVVYATDADPATMAVVMGGAMGAALDELDRQLTSGDGPAVLAAADAPPPEVVGGTVGAFTPPDLTESTPTPGAS